MNSSTPIAGATSPSSATPTGDAASPEPLAQAPEAAADLGGASSVVWRVILPLAFGMMEATPITLIALLILLAPGPDVAYAPLSLVALMLFTAACVWLARLVERGRAWMAARSLDGFVTTGYVLLWAAGLVVTIWLQITVFFPVPIVNTTDFLVQSSEPSAATSVTVSALCFTWLYIRAISFARVSVGAGRDERRNERTHLWLLTSFKWELVVFAGLLLLGAWSGDKATYYTTSLVALPLFVVGGLVAVAIARQTALVTSRSYAVATAAPQMWSRWLGVFAVVAVGALILFEALFLSGALGAILSAVAPLVNATGSALGHLFGALGSGLKGHPGQTTPHTTPNQGGTTTTQPQTTPSSQPSSGGTISISGLLVIALAIVAELALLVGVFLIALWRRRLAGKPDAAPLRRLLGIVMWVLLALAILLPLLVALLIISALTQPPGSMTHSVAIPLPGGGSLSIQLPFSIPSLGIFSSGTSTKSGTGTSTPTSPSAPHKQTTNSPLSILLLILEIIAAVGILAAVVALVILAVIGVRMFLRWRRARRATNAPALTAATAQAQPDPALRGDAARVYYRRLLQAAATVGGEYARRPAETPREYAARIQPLLARPDAPAQLRQAAAPVGLAAPADDETRVALDELTSAYRVARYRGDPTDDDRAARLRPWLARLLSALGA